MTNVLFEELNLSKSLHWGKNWLHFSYRLWCFSTFVAATICNNSVQKSINIVACYTVEMVSYVREKNFLLVTFK